MAKPRYARDKSHTPDKMCTTLSPEHELIVLELRKTLLVPTDDLLAVTHEFINRRSRALDWDVAFVAKCLGSA